MHSYVGWGTLWDVGHGMLVSLGTETWEVGLVGALLCWDTSLGCNMFNNYIIDILKFW